MENPDAQMSLENCCPIVELRQYTLHPGQRDVLIDLFDREFIESQESVRDEGHWAVPGPD